MAKKDAYLLTSPGFAGQLALNLLLMGALAAACVTVQPLFELGQALHDLVTEQMMHAAHRMAWWSLLGLLSSSCCALQIMLNAFSFGCAGFNSTLGPLRPTFVALTITVQTLSWVVAWSRPFQWPATAAATAVSLVLTLLPEALALRTARRERAAAANPATAEQQHKRVRLQLSSLGCAACVDKVSTVLGATPAVLRHSVSLEDGIATLELEPSCAVETIVERLEGAGFPAKPATDAAKPSKDDEDEKDEATEEGGGKGAWWEGNGAAVCAGLLSSSCCLLQLGLNALAMLDLLHIGCAGFVSLHPSLLLVLTMVLRVLRLAEMF